MIWGESAKRLRTIGFCESHDLVVKTDGTRSRGLNPGTVYWMDISDASYYIKIQVVALREPVAIKSMVF